MRVGGEAGIEWPCAHRLRPIKSPQHPSDPSLIATPACAQATASATGRRSPGSSRAASACRRAQTLHRWRRPT
eukprot:363193-Chlamydomonas_euryale.AAC.1